MKKRCPCCGGLLSNNLIAQFPCYIDSNRYQRCVLSWQCEDCHSCFEFGEGNEVIRFSSNLSFEEGSYIYSCKEHNHFELKKNDYDKNGIIGRPFMTIENYLKVVFHDPSSN